MKQKNEIYEAVYSSAAVDECSDKIRHFLAANKTDSRDIVRYTLSAEEILLNTAEVCGEDFRFTLTYGTKFFHPFISIQTDCAAYNVFSKKDSEQSRFGSTILKNLGLSPEYTYTNDKNVYSFRIKKKALNPFVSLVISLGSAIVIGLLGMLLPDGVRNAVLTGVLDPLHDTFFHILGCIAGPMVFLSVAWGIYGIGDAATLKRIGKRLISNYIGIVFFYNLVACGISFIFFRLNFTGGTGGSKGLSEIVNMLLGIIPSDIVSPFVNGNTLQIIFLAILIGFAMLVLGQKTNVIADIIQEINLIIQLFIEFISHLVPIFIFIIFVSIIWSGSAGIFTKVLKLFGAAFAAVTAALICIIAYTAVKTKTSPLILIKKGLPSLLIAITTASSAATFSSNVKSCKTGYGIDDSVTSFGLPLGMVIFKPAMSVTFFTVSVFFAEMYKLNVSATWYVMLIFTAVILAVATPPVPGGSFTIYTVLFTQMGIPSEAIAVALACDTLFDFIDTGTDQFLLPLVLLGTADKLGLVNRNILRENKKR